MSVHSSAALLHDPEQDVIYSDVFEKRAENAQLTFVWYRAVLTNGSYRMLAHFSGNAHAYRRRRVVPVSESIGLAGPDQPDIASAVRKLVELGQNRISVHGYAPQNTLRSCNHVEMVAAKHGIALG